MSEKFKNSEFIGTDICDNMYGIYEKLYKRVYKVPHVNAQDYRAMMEQIIRQEVIDAVVVIPELEVLYWSSNPFQTPHIIPPPKFSQSVISKRNLYDSLSGSGLIPGYSVFKRSEIQSCEFGNPFGYPCWVRDFAEGSTSGKGATWLQVESN
jgi:carbamoyl-phosphate synthase large subunit